MKELLVRGDKTLNEEIIKLKVDDEDYDVLSMFDWVAHETLNTKIIKITTKRDYPKFKYKSWFGEELPKVIRYATSLSLEALMEHMLYDDCKWYLTPSIKFINNDRTDYRKSNLDRPNKPEIRRSHERISELRADMYSSIPKGLEAIAKKDDNKSVQTSSFTHGWGSPVQPSCGGIPLGFGFGRPINAATIPGFAVIKIKGNSYAARTVCSRASLEDLLGFEFMDTQDIYQSGKSIRHYAKNGDTTIFILETSITQRLENEINNIGRYVSGLVIDDDAKMDTIETLVNYIAETINYNK